MVKKVLITGLGSIGQRHARCLKALYGENVELHAYRTRGLKQTVKDSPSGLIADNETDPSSVNGIVKVFDNLNEALKEEYYAVFVTNPPDLHVETTKKALLAGANVFIEKPISHNLDGIEELIKISDENGLKVMVGHQLRYHIITRRMKEILRDGIIGKLISAEFVFGEYLPNMHAYEDYRISHAVSEKRGGGAILSLNHDIDIACYLLGMPTRLFCMGGNLSSLEMDCEDSAHILMEIKRKEGPMVVNVLLDFTQRPTRRQWLINGEKGAINVDLTKNSLTVTSYNNGKAEVLEESHKGFERNKMFIGEISDFFDSIDKNLDSPLGLAESYEIMKVAIMAKKSLKSGMLSEMSI